MLLPVLRGKTKPNRRANISYGFNANVKLACLFTCLKFLNSLDLAASPCMLSATTVLAKDLELPGFPTTNSGILSSMHTTIMNTFSLRAVFRAMLRPRSNSLSTARWQLKKIITYIYYHIKRCFEGIFGFPLPSII